MSFYLLIIHDFNLITACSLGWCGRRSDNPDSQAGCQLDITNRRGEVHTVPLQDARECVQVMMIIQTRCAAPSAGTTAAGGPSSVSRMTSSDADRLRADQGEGSKPLSPLVIGSSPVTTSRLANGKGGGGIQRSRRPGKKSSAHGLDKENVYDDDSNGESEHGGSEESPKKRHRTAAPSSGGGRSSHRLASIEKRKAFEVALDDECKNEAEANGDETLDRFKVHTGLRDTTPSISSCVM